MHPKEADTRNRMRARIARLARALLPLADVATERLVDELCRQTDISVRAFRGLFPTDDDLIRAVNQQILDECAERLQGAAGGVEASGDEALDLQSAARALAEAWPMDWATLTIRSRERAAALMARDGSRPDALLDTERGYAPAILEALVGVFTRIGREFVWEPLLAARVITLAYERSFEAWALAGGDERDFPASPFTTHTLPRILAGVSRPIAVRA
ncbi:hypothetical protein [Agromyces seonyuensis]|uniref:TetR/AcrR family transcriptional regulator n=1 Tax=Agromyces seonyuensis TaxID=2662446 RepID=A0A6I4NRZ2_9MICO|nr:hypothetical protein [Agromyces seonyuensis]MWB96993.1 hypothetical protein [Agromyces seonyuensis]